MIDRRLVLQALAASLLPVTATARPETTTIITGSAAGSPGDVVCRTLGGPLSHGLSRPVVVENRPGASGLLAVGTVARARPDGSMLGLLSLQSVVGPHLLPMQRIDPLTELAPLRQLASWGNVLVVANDGGPYTSVEALIAGARSGGLSYASGGNGTPAHLLAELFARSQKLSLQHVPFQGAAPAINALLGGHVTMMFATTSVVLGPLKAGRLRALAVSTRHRSGLLPELPTLYELGLRDVVLHDWMGLAGPAAMAPELQASLGAAVDDALASDPVRQRLQELGFERSPFAGAAAFAAFAREESARWGELIRAARIHAN